MARVTINPDAIRQIQQRADDVTNDVVERVSKQMAGRPVAEVERVLADELTRAGLEPNAEGVRAVAAGISQS